MKTKQEYDPEQVEKDNPGSIRIFSADRTGPVEDKIICILLEDGTFIKVDRNIQREYNLHDVIYVINRLISNVDGIYDNVEIIDLVWFT